MYVQYNLAGEHGMLWDPAAQPFWALGEEYLVSLQVGGTLKSARVDGSLQDRTANPVRA